MPHLSLLGPLRDVGFRPCSPSLWRVLLGRSGIGTGMAAGDVVGEGRCDVRRKCFQYAARPQRKSSGGFLVSPHNHQLYVQYGSCAPFLPFFSPIRVGCCTLSPAFLTPPPPPRLSLHLSPYLSLGPLHAYAEEVSAGVPFPSVPLSPLRMCVCLRTPHRAVLFIHVFAFSL